MTTTTPQSCVKKKQPLPLPLRPSATSQGIARDDDVMFHNDISFYGARRKSLSVYVIITRARIACDGHGAVLCRLVVDGSAGPGTSRARKNRRRVYVTSARRETINLAPTTAGASFFSSERQEDPVGPHVYVVTFLSTRYRHIACASTAYRYEHGRSAALGSRRLRRHRRIENRVRPCGRVSHPRERILGRKRGERRPDAALAVFAPKNLDC